MTNVGWATLDVIPSLNGFQSRLERGTTPGLLAAGRTGGTRFGDAAGRSAGARFSSVFGKAARAGALGGLALAAGAVKLGADSISLASDQQESINAVNVAYGKQARGVQKLGKQAAKSLALPRSEFNELAVRFSKFASTISGGNGRKTVRTLDDLTSRAGDFASVFNVDVAEAAGLFQSGLAGETEPLRKFGIDMSAAAVEAFAYANGIAESGSKLTENQKVQARYALLMQETNKTQGDLANTSDSLANRQRFLSARWDDARAKLGKGLLPIVESFSGFLLDHAIPAVEDFSDWFTRDGIPAIKDLGKKLRPLADELLPAAKDGFKGIRDFAEDALPFAEGIVGAFNDMPGWVKKVLVLGTAGALTAKKLGLGKVGGDLFSRGSSPARPLFVRVTNPGVGTGAGVGADGKPTTAGPKGIGLLGIAAALAPPEAFQDVLNEPELGDIEANTKAYHRQQDAIEEIRREWALSKDKANDYNMFVRNKLPGEIQFTVLGWPVAQQQARDYLATLLEIRAVHQENRLEFGPSGSAPTSSGGGGSGGGKGDPLQAASRGLVVNNTYNVNTTRDAVKYGEHRGHQIAAGGFGD